MTNEENRNKRCDKLKLAKTKWPAERIPERILAAPSGDNKGEGASV